jgi:hypothetical protein
MYNATQRYFSAHIEDVDFNLCSLNVYIGQTHLTYALAENNRVVCYEKYHLGTDLLHALPNFITENRWLLQNYQNVAIAVNNPAFMISPMHLDIPADVLTALHGDMGADVQHSLYIQKHQLKVTYTIPETLEKILLENFRGASIKPYAALAVAEVKRFDGVQINVHCLDEYFTIVIFKGNALQLAKTVDVVNNEKLSYQLLGYVQMLQLNKSPITIWLSGWIVDGAPLQIELSKYFERVVIDNTYTKYICDNDEHEPQYFNTFEIISYS